MAIAKRKEWHKFHAEAATLDGELKLPFAQKTCSHTSSKLNENGGYVTQHADRLHLGGVIGFRSSYTHVGGNLDTKPDHGWNTITTAVIEGLNVMEVVTADRVVAQISTDHPLDGYVPRVTFLGTRIENLRIAGSEPLKIHYNHSIVGDKPADDAAYTTDEGFIQRVASQYEHIRGHENLPDELAERYNQASASANRGSVECSLVNQVEGSFPGRSFGHILYVPDFGKIHLATLKIEHSDFEEATPKLTTISLTMLRCEMGCIGGGTVTLAGGKTNGLSGP